MHFEELGTAQHVIEREDTHRVRGLGHEYLRVLLLCLPHESSRQSDGRQEVQFSPRLRQGNQGTEWGMDLSKVTQLVRSRAGTLSLVL